MELAEEIRYLILAIQREGNRILATILSKHELTPSQAEVIALLGERGTLGLKELGEMLVCETGDSPSRLVSRLIDKGLLSRERDEIDGRAVSLSLTPGGRKLYKSVVQPSDRAMREILEKVLTAKQQQNLKELLSHLSNSIGANNAIQARLRNRASK